MLPFDHWTTITVMPMTGGVFPDVGIDMTE
jgi:hypothetical protein